MSLKFSEFSELCKEEAINEYNAFIRIYFHETGKFNQMLSFLVHIDLIYLGKILKRSTQKIYWEQPPANRQKMNEASIPKQKGL